MTYDSKKYWNTRTNPNKGSEPELVDEKFIPPFVKDANTIFEFGVGVGRMFKFYKDALIVTGVDFAKQYQYDAKKQASKYIKDYRHTIHNVHDEPLPYLTQSHEKGLLIKVLLHAPHDEALTIIKEMARVCKEVLIISYNGTSKGLAPHCFKHDYRKMLDELGYKYQVATMGNQIIIKYEDN